MYLGVCGTDHMWWVHALSRFDGGFVSSCVTECTRLFLDVRRLFTGSLMYKECLGSSVKFLFYRDVVALLTSSGTIPAGRYTFSTYVGLRHPVVKRHA